MPICHFQVRLFSALQPHTASHLALKLNLMHCFLCPGRHSPPIRLFLIFGDFRMLRPRVRKTYYDAPPPPTTTTTTLKHLSCSSSLLFYSSPSRILVQRPFSAFLYSYLPTMTNDTAWPDAASTVKYSIQLGTWVNWSRGRVMGATLTMNRVDGNLLIAFTAVFVGIVTERIWRIACMLVSNLPKKNFESSSNTQNFHPFQACSN